MHIGFKLQPVFPNLPSVSAWHDKNFAKPDKYGKDPTDQLSQSQNFLIKQQGGDKVALAEYDVTPEVTDAAWEPLKGVYIDSIAIGNLPK